MKSIENIKKLKGKRVLLRLDLNVPVKNGVVLSDFRIKKIMPTIKFLRKQGAKIIILSHIGRKETNTLSPVFNYLKNVMDLIFIEDIFSEKTNETIKKMENGDIVMLENLRKYKEENENDDEFARHLVSFGDIYVNEAFAFSHRKAASIMGIPKYLPSYFGLLFIQEVEALSQSFNPQRPAVFILGGNKFETKLPLIKKTLKTYDKIFIGGALANNFFKEKGFEIGLSLVSNQDFNLSNILKNKKLFLPVDVTVKNGKTTIIKKSNEVLDNEVILDAGTQTISELRSLLKGTKFVLFNGPLGDYTKGFSRATANLVRIISELDIKSIIGGGDTVANIFELGFENKFDFISTGGGAMLEFLLKETLPGIEAIKNQKK